MNRFGNICLDISSLAIVLFILSFCCYTDFINLIFGSLFLFLLCWSMLKLAQVETECFEVNFDSVEEEDNKSYWVFTGLIIPILQESFNLPLYQYMIISIVFLVIYWKSISFIYNPVLLLLRYHYYHVSVNGKSFSLISQRKIMNPRENITVGKLSNNLIIAKNGE